MHPIRGAAAPRRHRRRRSGCRTAPPLSCASGTLASGSFIPRNGRRVPDRRRQAPAGGVHAWSAVERHTHGYIRTTSPPPRSVDVHHHAAARRDGDRGHHRPLVQVRRRRGRGGRGRVRGLDRQGRHRGARPRSRASSPRSSWPRARPHRSERSSPWSAPRVRWSRPRRPRNRQRPAVARPATRPDADLPPGARITATTSPSGSRPGAVRSTVRHRSRATGISAPAVGPAEGDRVEPFTAIRRRTADAPAVLDRDGRAHPRGDAGRLRTGGTRPRRSQGVVPHA